MTARCGASSNRRRRRSSIVKNLWTQLLSKRHSPLLARRLNQPQSRSKFVIELGIEVPRNRSQIDANKLSQKIKIFRLTFCATLGMHFFKTGVATFGMTSRLPGDLGMAVEERLLRLRIVCPSGYSIRKLRPPSVGIVNTSLC